MSNEAPPTGLPDPYGESLFSPNFRLNVNVMTDDILLIQSVAPSRGTKQYLIAAYVKSLADELRANGITYYSAENLRKFAAIVERRNKWDVLGAATASTPRPKRGGHDGRGKKGVRNSDSNSAGVNPSTEK